MVAGFKRYYKGNIVEEIFTKPGQQDYQAEITQLRSKNPKATFVFYPGGMGIQFVKQYVQAGLRDRIPLYSVFTVDETTLPALKEAALGQYEGVASDLLLYVIDNEIHHRGQGYVYLRSLGVDPPPFYDRS